MRKVVGVSQATNATLAFAGAIDALTAVASEIDKLPGAVIGADLYRAAVQLIDATLAQNIADLGILRGIAQPDGRARLICPHGSSDPEHAGACGARKEPQVRLECAPSSSADTSRTTRERL